MAGLLHHAACALVRVTSDSGRPPCPKVHDDLRKRMFTFMNPFHPTILALSLLNVIVWAGGSADPCVVSASSSSRADASRRQGWRRRQMGSIIESRRSAGRVRGERSIVCLRLGDTDDWFATGDGGEYDGFFDGSGRRCDVETSREYLSTLPPRRRRIPILEFRTWNQHRAADSEGRSSPFVLLAASTSFSSASFQDSSRPRRPGMWPPWPFSLLQSRRETSAFGDGETGSAAAPASQGQRPQGTGSLLWPFLRQSAHAGLLNLQYMTSQLLFHLPPASPPLLILACIPQHRKVLESTGAAAAASAATVAAESTVRTWIVPLTSDPFVRTIALSCLGLAVLSWAHSQVHRLNAMTPLPLAPEFRDVHRAVLPPFLPDEERAHHRFLDAADALLGDDDDGDGAGLEQGETGSGDALSPSFLQSSLLQWKPFGDGTGSRNAWRPGGGRVRGALRAWRQEREARQVDRRNAHRIAVMDQLLALQTLKRKSEARTKGKKGKSRGEANLSASLSSIEDGSGRGMGYGVVTGASRGIGRAIAVELARFGIPLVLVARDLDRLTSLAYDLQACYGVDCCVLQADLTKPHTAAAVYRSIQDAGLTVDILVNNAGLSSHGLSVDMPMQEVDNMLAVNVQAVTTLAHLFGKDMKERRMGRILMVSSVNGAVSGIPTVSVYTATKAFERTLATSLGREMEPYGVGVTCLLPGAVRDTDFRSRSNAEHALCWKIPFYLKTPAQVAEMGVRALLLGQPEATPGWMNRAFLKFVQPVLPPRMHSLVAEVVWNPLRMPWHQNPAADVEDLTRKTSDPSTHTPRDDPHTRSTRLRYKIDSAPRLLTLEETPQALEESPPVNGTSAADPAHPEPAATDASADATAAAPALENNESATGDAAQIESPPTAVANDERDSVIPLKT